MASLEADLSGITCGGYDLKLVDGGSLTNKYICPVCQLVAREPYRAECGQVYCKSCLQKIKSKENNFVCPTCQGFPCDFFFDNQADLEIKSLRVFCKNTKCYWKGNLGDINNHLQECLYQLILCHSCNASLHRRNLNEHLRSKCPKRQINCEHCNQMGTFEYITNRHRLLCAVKCTNEGCNEMMPPQQLSSHKELSCAKETISCQFNTIGCEKLIKREHKMLHNVEWKDQHMLLAVREIDNLKKSKRSLKCKIEDLEEATTSNSKRTNLQANLRQIQVEQASCQDLQHTLNNLQFETSKLQEGLTNLQSSVEVLEKSQKATD
jgi:TNF receptor-associated factor 4